MSTVATEVQRALPRLRSLGLARRVATLATLGRSNALARLVWADDDAHREAFPEHIGLCQQCGIPFDRRVSLDTGEHHTARRADYCTAKCQDTGRPSRSGRTLEAPIPYRETEVRPVLSRVRAHLARDYWAPMARSEWALLELGAPDVAVGLRFYEDMNEAQRRAASGAKRLGKAQTERLRGELVARIDDWFRTNEENIA